MAGAPARDRLAIVRRARTRRFLAMRPFPALHGGPLLGLDSTEKPSVKQAFYPSQRRGRDSNPRWTNQARPMILAIWVAAIPTPPAAAWMRTRSRSRSEP